MNQRGKLILLGVLLLLLGAAAWWSFLRPAKGRKATAKSSGPAAKASATAAPKTSLPSSRDLERVLAWVEQPPVGSDEARLGGRFGVQPVIVPFMAPPPPPTRSAAPPPKPGDPPRITGVIRVGNVPKIIVDGETFGVGEAVRDTGYRVLDIRDGVVRFRDNLGNDVVINLVN